MIRLRNITYSYPNNKDLALKNLSLEIGEKEFLAIVGRNGSGKSTLARLLNGSLLPASGQVEVDGLDTAISTNGVNIRKRVGLLLPVPDNQLVSNIVEEDVAFGPENIGLAPDEIRYRVDTALKMVSMEDYAKHPPYLLSGGQKQRICIAGLLALRPKYMVLDEPSSMLDPRARAEVLKVLLEVKEKTGIAIILITHRLEEVLDADRIAILEDGELKIVAPPSGILHDTTYLREIGLEPLEISVLIEHINKKCGSKIRSDIYKIDQLVEELCLLQ